MATAREVKARWAFSEVLSDRFGGPYSSVLPQPLYAQVTAGGNFSSIQQSDWDVLIQGLNAARNPAFTSNVDAGGPNGYICAEWSIEDLMNARVIPNFGASLYYRQFLTMFPVSQRNGAIDLADPRFKAWGTTVLGAPFVQTEPLISVRDRSDYMLIEGYTRSILWVRNPTKPLLMWVPV